MTADDRTVRVIACAEDAAVRDVVTHLLRTMGVRVVEADERFAAGVILISPAAADDSAWCREVSGGAGARLVPVRIRDVDPNRIPGVVRELNWIEWDAEDPRATCATVFAALTGDLNRYRLHRSLAAEAGAWDAANRSKDLLIQDRARAKVAAEHVAHIGRDDLLQPTGELRAFVVASLAATRRARRRQRLRWIFRAFVAGGAIVGLLFLYTQLRAGGAGSNVGMLAAYGGMVPSRPDRTAILGVDAIVRDDARYGALARTALREALSQRWSVGVVGAMAQARVQYARLTSHGDRVLTLDGLGELAEWQRDTLDAKWRRSLETGAFPSAFDATDDGRRVAATAGRSLIVVRVEPWRREVAPLPSEAESLALDPADGAISIGTVDGRLLSVAAGGSHAVRTVLRAAAILALRRTATGHVRALVRLNGRTIALIDARSGRVLARARAREWEFERGAIGPDGVAVAVTSPDRQILYARHGLALRSTGQAVPDVIDVLEILPGDRVVFGGAVDGVAVLDVSRRLVLGRICTTLAAVVRVSGAADGDLVACADQQVIDLWHTRDLSPIRPPHDRRMVSSKPAMRNSGVAVAGDAEGFGAIATRWRRAPLQVRVARAPVTASAVFPPVPTAVFGAANGEVTEVDFAYDGGQTSHWTAPDHAAIAAVGWTSGHRRLLVRTAAGNWWSPWSCARCGSVDAMVAHVAARRWGCYVPDLIRIPSPGTRALLRLRTCAPLPEPRDP